MSEYLDKNGLQHFSEGFWNKIGDKFATKTMVGAPLVANTAADMTDQDRIYVYAGTETGYTAGHWYYYNGSWQDGGAYNASAPSNDSVRYDTAQSKSKSEKRQAIKNIGVYDDILQTVKITSSTTTMGDITEVLTEVNTAGDHVLFDVSALNTGMYLCTIYIGGGFYRVADMVTGFEKHGFFKNSDLLVDILNSTPSTDAKHYTLQWDKVNAKGVRLNDAASITDNTANFGHFGSVNENYDNPFDSIYPWSGRKLCNIDIPTYRALTPADDITDCVVAWEGDVNFDYEHEYGVWVYTPSFFGRTYELGNYRYFDVTDEFNQHNIEYPAMITGRWLGADVQLTLDGASKHCTLPTVGMPMANVSMTNMHAYAKNFGGSLVDIYNIDASALLFVVEYGTLNSQTALGSGCANLYKQGMHPDSAVSGGNVISVTATGLSAALLTKGAIVDIGTADGGNNIARTSVVSATLEGNTATITLADNVTVAVTDFVSLHGIINNADEDIGSMSGYIGANGYVNAYYRGECLYGNKYQYILGAYRQTGTGHIWICDRDTTDDYDALNTSVHKDTGLVLPQGAGGAAASGYIKTLGMAEGLAIPPFCTEIGGTSASPVGDYYYVPELSTVNTILLLGGTARIGAYDGLFFGHWTYTASNSNWHIGARSRLVNP